MKNLHGILGKIFILFVNGSMHRQCERGIAPPRYKIQVWFEKLHGALAVAFTGCYSWMLRMRAIKLSWQDIHLQNVVTRGVCSMFLQNEISCLMGKWNWPNLSDIPEFQGCLGFDLHAKTLVGNANWVMLN